MHSAKNCTDNVGEASSSDVDDDTDNDGHSECDDDDNHDDDGHFECDDGDDDAWMSMRMRGCRRKCVDDDYESMPAM